MDLSVPKVMAIVNCTPDSFYDGSSENTLSTILTKVQTYVAEGADILDIGGMSSRPGANMLTVEDEIARILPVIEAVHAQFPAIPISVDTFRWEVAEAALNAGASMVNDIMGGQFDEKIWKITRDANAAYVLMHMRGDATNMQDQTTYKDLRMDVLNFLEVQTAKAIAVGLKDVLVDPGIGFAKTLKQNFRLLKDLSLFRMMELPILIGLSRKSMIYKSLECSAAEALNGTTSLHTLAIQNGVSILRVHDVKAAKEVISLNEIYKKA